MATTKPDFDDYLDRIQAIQLAVVSGSQSSKYPLPSAPSYYWVNVYLPGRFRVNTDSRSGKLTIVCQMQLIRGPKTNVFQPEIEAQIVSDIADVLWAFITDSNYRRLIVSTYTAIQPGFIPGSLRITTMSRAELSQGNPLIGELLGSFYNLEWQHNMMRSIGV